MKTPHQNATEYNHRLAYWRTHAWQTFFLMLGAIVAVSFLQKPDPWFTGASVLGGVAIFFSWQLNPSKRPYGSLAAGLLGVMVILLGMLRVNDWPLEFLIIHGMAAMAASFSICMAVSNAKKS
jgi:hypothetical protein